MERSIGRSNDCEIVILDPKNRVSRNHAMLRINKGTVFIKDVGSANGTYVNGNKISVGTYIELSKTDKVTLAKDYVFDFSIYLDNSSGDETLILSSSSKENTVIFERDRVTVSNNDKTVVFDPNRTAIGDLSEMDNSPFKILGRGTTNDFVVNNANVSREHCKIRLLTPVMLEIEDLGSSNGTFADNTKLEPGRKYKFSSSVKIGLSNSYLLDLKKVFPNIQIINKQETVKPRPNPQSRAPITAEEKASFMELEDLWNEYNSRNTKAGKISSGYGMGGATVGLAVMALVPGAGFMVSAGIGLLGRYLGQQKSNEIRTDLSYENMFLETYCCPRCKESFQRKPWITIRDCFKCKLSFK